MPYSSKIIFDIETAGFDLDAFDENTQSMILKNTETDEEIKNVQDSLSFSPLTAQIVAIGMLNPNTDKGQVLYQEPSREAESVSANNSDISYIPCPTEKDLLVKFWDAMKHYDQFITFNGRSFDCPFIITRSAVNGVEPTKDLMPNRYYDSHIDLFDRLTFFGAVWQKKNYSLHFWTKAFGVKSPKEDGVTGYQVKDMFQAGKNLEIAKYCGGDLWATKELFLKWEKFYTAKR